MYVFDIIKAALKSSIPRGRRWYHLAACMYTCPKTAALTDSLVDR